MLNKTMATIGICAGLVLATAAYAQPPQQQPNQQPPQQDQPQQTQPTDQQPSAPANFKEQDLKNYVKASTAMKKIRQEFTEKAQKVSDPEKRGKLRQKTNDKLVNAIKKNDLSVQKFTEINQAIRSNPDLADKVEKLK